MLKKLMLYLSILMLILSTGCNRYYSNGPEDENLVEVSYSAVDNLLVNLKHPLPEGSLVVINSLVNVDNLSQTFSFGRIISDQISSAFHRADYQVMGMELPTELFVKNDAGILNLSPKAKEALNDVGAKALVIGSFAPGKRNAYISLRIVDIASQNIIATTDFSVPIGPDAKVLLKPKEIDKKKNSETSSDDASSEF